jgi:DNA-binding GntR family transcriptional regulator
LSEWPQSIVNPSPARYSRERSLTVFMADDHTAGEIFDQRSGPERSGPVYKTVEEHIFEAVRERIVLGSLAPGSPLRLADLAGEFGVSTMPIRVALSRLESEGLVHQLPRRGSIVAPLNLHDFEEIQAIRAGVEGFAARLGAERIDDAGLERMGTLLERLRDVEIEGDIARYLKLAWELQATCYLAAGRQELFRLIQDVRRRAERYIRVAVASSPGLGAPVSYHLRMFEACSAHDGERAEQVIREGLQWAITHVEPVLDPPDEALAASSVGT